MYATATTSALSFCRITEVMQLTGLSRATIYAKVAEGAFPESVDLGSRAIAFVRAEVEAWMEERIRQSRSGTRPSRKKMPSSWAERHRSTAPAPTPPATAGPRTPTRKKKRVTSAAPDGGAEERLSA